MIFQKIHRLLSICRNLNVVNIQTKNLHLSQNVFMPGAIKKSKVKKADMKRKLDLVRPLWFVFGGLGAQWQGMGKELMRIDQFHNSIQKSKIILLNENVNVDELLDLNNKGIHLNIRDAITATIIMQVALYDALMAAGIAVRLDDCGYFGHSIGEITCSYAEEGITGEEAVLIADALGKSLVESQKVEAPGAMVQITGIPWEEIKDRFYTDTDICIAHHDAADQVTFSGPKDDIQGFLAELQSSTDPSKVQVKEIYSFDFALHNPNTMNEAKELYQKKLELVYGKSVDRYRWKDWITTCMEKEDWNRVLAKTAAPEYYVHNMIQPVYFHEAVLEIPKKSVIVEISPQGVFQGHLKQAAEGNCHAFAPMQKDVSDPLKHFIQSVEDIAKAGSIKLNEEVLKDWKLLLEAPVYQKQNAAVN